MSARPPLRGRGYMKKGGAHATHEHNELVRRATSEDASPVSHPAPLPDTGRTRVSAVASWPLIAAAWCLGAVSGGGAVALLSALEGAL